MGAPITAEVVNAFIDPVLDLVKMCIGIDAELDDLGMTDQIDPPPSLSVTIDFKGRLVGPITWIFTPELARRFANKMLPLESAGTSMEWYPEAAAELANIVTGNATGRLIEAGYEVEILPPRLRGSGYEDRQLTERTLAVTLDTEAGAIKILIGVQITEIGTALA